MCADGFDVAALIAHKQAGGKVGDFAQGEPCSADALLDVPSDIWIPAARPDVLRADNVDRLITKVVAQGANTLEVLSSATREGILPRAAALAMAAGRVKRAMSYRRGS